MKDLRIIPNLHVVEASQLLFKKESEILISASEIEYDDQEDSLNDSSHQPTQGSIVQRAWEKFKESAGWRRGVIYCIATSLFVLSFTLTFVVWAATQHKTGSGIVLLFQGSCKKSKRMSIGFHLIINVLSTLLLSASNYCMHVVSAPSRQDIDRMHASKITMDIGLNSFGNILKLPWNRRILWALLGLSSIPLHLMANSSIFPSTAAYSYTAAVVTTDFFEGYPWHPDYLESVSMGPKLNTSKYRTFSSEWIAWMGKVQEGSIRLKQLDHKTCVKTYANHFITNNGNLLLVTKDYPVSVGCLNSSVLSAFRTGYDYGSVAPQSRVEWMTYNWFCSKHKNGEPGSVLIDLPHCSSVLSSTFLSFSLKVDKQSRCYNTSNWPPPAIDIDYCLTQEVEEACTVEASIVILTVVVAFTACKLACMIWMLYFLREKPIVVIGDAIACFLKYPDVSTFGACLRPSSLFKKNKFWRQARRWRSRPELWGTAVSPISWAVCWVLWLAATCSTFYFFVYAQERNPYGTLATSAFDNIDPTFMLTTSIKGNGSSTSSLLPPVLLANTPQLVSSFLYITYNAVWTSMLVDLEWNSYAHHRRSLRVSYPVGSQRSTHRIHLPYRYGIPMILVFGATHWLISQGLFLVPIHLYDAESLDNWESSVFTCGYSLQAILSVLIVCVVAMVIVLLFGFRKYQAGMTLIRCSSAAISAACHSRPDEDPHAAEGPLKWGVVEFNGRVGHCCFSSGPVSFPKENRLYA
ncbi:hypothetical protein B0J11DRAFT_230512 [Dendryphion nanum]|uniref:DUF6536 domain-containing protein n=1 Tax=Dendryphion nanum TaxID=256645 RepID=A0A9P9E7V9_9PLEO|nr:hypothetical protein B0J11DRAFT_230512 [Dendryphion nanum]